MTPSEYRYIGSYAQWLAGREVTPDMLTHMRRFEAGCDADALANLRRVASEVMADAIPECEVCAGGGRC